jgi:magnesium-transporting ATPase (P-type)
VSRTTHPAEESSTVRWYTLEADETSDRLGTGGTGLTAEEAAVRLERYGPNEVEPERPTPGWKLLLHQLHDTLIYVLLAAAAVTAFLEEWADTSVIVAVVVLNTLIGYVQEARAQRAVRALARMTASTATVVRDGIAREIPGREVVPGDLLQLTSGDRVPADLRLVSVRDLEVDESALTGESRPVRKSPDVVRAELPVPGDQVNLAFAGTVVTRGRARGFAVRTGGATELGRIATTVREVGETETPLQEKFGRLGGWIGRAVLALTAVVAGIGTLRGLAPEEVLLTAVAMAVATIPEGLPVVLTVTLSVGVRRMARRNAIVRALPAVETLGSTTVIGSDKTGTLTRNEMTVRAVWAGGTRYAVGGGGYDPEGEFTRDDRPVDPAREPALRATLLAGTLANEADAGAIEAADPRGDPTEVALHVAWWKTGSPPEAPRRQHREVDLLPFEPERRLMATLNDGPSGRRIWMKGAPEAVLARCTLALTAEGEVPVDADEVRRAASELAADGLRVIAMASREESGSTIDEDALETGFVFLGLEGMEDPVRPEAVEAVREAHRAGVRVLMLTGDHLETARAIGQRLELRSGEGEVLEGSALAGMSDQELDRSLERVEVFARVAPEHKLRIVQRLKERGEIVAVTGDGVNDAPALRAAHLGIAMGRAGTDVAREASDMVLADDNFASITAAVEEGRVVFSNLRKATFFLLSTGVGMPIAITTALLLGWPLPFLAAQILWINLVTNGLQDVALAFEPAEPGLLRRPPRPAREGVLTRALVLRLLPVGAILAAGTLATFWWTLQGTGDLAHARTAAMTQMVVFQFFHVFNSRSMDRSILRVPLFSNRFLFVATAAAAAAHLMAVYAPPLQALFRTVPLGAGEWLAIVAVGSTVVLGGELDKLRNRRAGRSLG